MLKNLNLQLLADGEPAGSVTPTTPAAPAPTPTGKVFTEDYVLQLREEAKTNRLAKKAAESTVRKLIGLKDDEDIDETKISAYQTRQTQAVTEAVAKANARIISAEIKLQADKYDPKLLDRLIDRSKITVDDNGEVKGLQEQLPALEIEFPAIKKGVQTPGGFNPATPSTLTELQQLETALGTARAAGNNPLVIALQNKIFELQK